MSIRSLPPTSLTARCRGIDPARHRCHGGAAQSGRSARRADRALVVVQSAGRSAVAAAAAAAVRVDLSGRGRRRRNDRSFGRRIPIAGQATWELVPRRDRLPRYGCRAAKSLRSRPSSGRIRRDLSAGQRARIRSATTEQVASGESGVAVGGSRRCLGPLPMPRLCRRTKTTVRPERPAWRSWPRFRNRRRRGRNRRPSP